MVIIIIIVSKHKRFGNEIRRIARPSIIVVVVVVIVAAAVVTVVITSWFSPRAVVVSFTGRSRLIYANTVGDKLSTPPPPQRLPTHRPVRFDRGHCGVRLFTLKFTLLENLINNSPHRSIAANWIPERITACTPLFTSDFEWTFAATYAREPPTSTLIVDRSTAAVSGPRLTPWRSFPGLESTRYHIFSLPAERFGLTRCTPARFVRPESGHHRRPSSVSKRTCRQVPLND